MSKIFVTPSFCCEKKDYIPLVCCSKVLHDKYKSHPNIKWQLTVIHLKSHPYIKWISSIINPQVYLFGESLRWRWNRVPAAGCSHLGRDRMKGIGCLPGIIFRGFFKHNIMQLYIYTYTLPKQKNGIIMTVCFLLHL